MEGRVGGRTGWRGPEVRAGDPAGPICAHPAKKVYGIYAELHRA